VEKKLGQEDKSRAPKPDKVEAGAPVIVTEKNFDADAALF
jgi:hypothetical protein